MTRGEGTGWRGKGHVERSGGHTQGAREQRYARQERQQRKKEQEKRRNSATREEGGAEGEHLHQETPRLAQRTAMQMTRIEPYQPPRPTIRELVEGRPAGAVAGGIPPNGYLGRPPKTAYRTEDRAQPQRRVRAREIQPWRGKDQRRTHKAGRQQ